MTGVCFQSDPDPKIQDQWSYVFSNFGVDEIWERSHPSAAPSPDCKIYQNCTMVQSCAELPAARKIVVLAPPTGRYFQGDENLLSFQHPEDAIYVFGGSHTNLTEECLGGRVPDHLVFIPVVEYELYAHVAAAITLYDRLVKNG